VLRASTSAGTTLRCRSWVLDIDYLLDEGVIDAEDIDLFWFAEEAGEV
jgi:hypothetical protein